MYVFPFFLLKEKVEQKSSRQTRTLRAFCLVRAQQHPTAFFIILLLTIISSQFLQAQLFQKLMLLKQIILRYLYGTGTIL
jgi:hypothetical protein